MSRAKANELLQTLVGKVNDLWSGKRQNINADEAYEICRHIVKEVDGGDSDDTERDSDKTAL
jgi:hypothetical protein